MKRWSKWFMVGIAVTLCMFVTTACKPKSEPTTAKEQLEAPTKAKLDVSFKVTPAEPTPNMIPTLQATVMQNNKAISDATVDLEVWKEGTNTHRMMNAPHTKDGTYAAESSLKEAGKYNVIVHVTTRNGLEQTIEGQYSVSEGKCCEGKDKKKKKCCEGH